MRPGHADAKQARPGERINDGARYRARLFRFVGVGADEGLERAGAVDMAFGIVGHEARFYAPGRPGGAPVSASGCTNFLPAGSPLPRGGE